MARCTVFAFAVVGLLIGCGDSSPKREEAKGTQVAHKTRREPALAPTPAPPAPPVDLSLGAGFEMRSAIRDGRMAIVPIVATGAVPATKYITLQEGMARGQVTVREMPDEWQVDKIRVKNNSEHSLLVMNGEVIVDAHQDRVISELAVIAPGATKEMAARCVEADRDHGGTTFNPGRALAELSLRRAAAHQTQTVIWNRVDAINARHGLSPSTKTYRHAALLQGKGVAGERRNRLAALLAAHPEREKIVGFAVAVDEEVVGIDRFATPELYRQVESRLLGSYAFADEAKPALLKRERPMLTPDEVRATMKLPNAVKATAASVAVLRPLEH